MSASGTKRNQEQADVRYERGAEVFNSNNYMTNIDVS